MSRLSAGSLTAIVVAIVVAVGVSRHAPTSRPSPATASPSTPAQAVSLVTAQGRDVAVAVDAAGTVVPMDTVDVRAQSSTTVRQVHLRDGDFVREGQLLFTLDDRADRANLDKARQQAAKDAATLADAKRQLARAQDLLAQGFIAPSAVDTARSAAEAAQAALRADDAAVQAAQVALGYDTLRAPLTGRAGLVAVHPGSLVSPTSGPLVTLSRVDPVEVQFTAPEADVPSLLAAVAAGTPVQAFAAALPPGDNAVPASASASASTSASSPPAASSAAASEDAGTLTGRLVFVDNAIDTTTGTIKAKARFANSPTRLWPGQYVRVRVTLRTLRDAVVVPQAALIPRGAGRGLYVVGTDGKARWRDVVPVQPDGEWIAIRGVRAGERVVVDGKQNVQDGTPVKVLPGTLAEGAERARPAERDALRDATSPTARTGAAS